MKDLKSAHLLQRGDLYLRDVADDAVVARLEHAPITLRRGTYRV